VTAKWRLPTQGQARGPLLHLLHRDPRGAGQCASSPSSSSAGASRLSWKPHGSSPQTPVGGQSVECTGTGLQQIYHLSVNVHVLSNCLAPSPQLGQPSPMYRPLGVSLSDTQLEQRVHCTQGSCCPPATRMPLLRACTAK
jgi:hypothetical protein